MSMGKIKIHEIDPGEKYRIVGDFFELISDLKSRKEVVDFFVGFMTSSELLMSARRIQIARMLLADKSYFEIKKKLKVGNETIFRTDKWLNSRGCEYKEWIRNHIDEVDNQKQSELKNKKISKSYNLLDKYPEYRLWKDILGR